MKEKKTVRMRKYQRSRAKAVMERKGRRQVCRHERSRKGERLNSYFALNWRDDAKTILRKKRT